MQDSTELAQSHEVAREKTISAGHKDHVRSSSSGAFPLRGDFQRAYDSIELRDLEPLDPVRGAEDYDALLPSLKRFFYLETKLLDEKTATLPTETPGSENEKSLLNLKAHIVSSYYLLETQETALRVTTLTSLIENTCCNVVSAALGILVYIEGSREWTTIASYTLFGLCLVYKVFDYTAYVLEAWFEVSEADYKRLMTEARKREYDTEYRGLVLEEQH